MQLIVISSPVAIPKEADLINQLFDEGLSVFHIRKPEWGKDELVNLLTDIDHKYYNRIALHQCHELANECEITRLHFKEEERKKTSIETFNKLKSRNLLLSTSVHRAEDYYLLGSHFNYAFFGPVYPSISKENYAATSDIIDFKTKGNYPPCIALGGINEGNITEIQSLNFNGAAVLGAIWKNPKRAIEKFKEIKTSVQSELQF